MLCTGIVDYCNYWEQRWCTAVPVPSQRHHHVQGRVRLLPGHEGRNSQSWYQNCHWDGTYRTYLVQLILKMKKQLNLAASLSCASYGEGKQVGCEGGAVHLPRDIGKNKSCFSRKFPQGFFPHLSLSLLSNWDLADLGGKSLKCGMMFSFGGGGGGRSMGSWLNGGRIRDLFMSGKRQSTWARSFFPRPLFFFETFIDVSSLLTRLFFG